MVSKICTLKGYNSESIEPEYYPGIKKAYQDLCEVLLLNGFQAQDIKIEFDDENRQIHFGYYPDEIDALAHYLPDAYHLLQENYTAWPFEKHPWIGNRYSLWHYKTTLDYLEEAKALIALYNNLESQRPNHPSAIDFPKGPHKNNTLEFIQQALRKDIQGIFINEIHSHIYPKKYLVTYLEYFKVLGFKTLFFEFLFYDRHQQLLDEYFASENDNLPIELACYLKLKDEASNCGFSGYSEIVVAAKKAGIRIVALDNYASILTFGELRSHFDERHRIDTRLLSFNGYAAEIIKTESKGEPYLAFLGLEHGYSEHEKYSKISSVPQLLPATCSMFLADETLSLSAKSSNTYFNKLTFFPVTEPMSFSTHWNGPTISVDILDDSGHQFMRQLTYSR